MNNKKLFQKAHVLAKQIVEKYNVDYQTQFTLCLEYLQELVAEGKETKEEIKNGGFKMINQLKNKIGNTVKKVVNKKTIKNVIKKGIAEVITSAIVFSSVGIYGVDTVNASSVVEPIESVGIEERTEENFMIDIDFFHVNGANGTNMGGKSLINEGIGIHLEKEDIEKHGIKKNDVIKVYSIVENEEYTIQNVKVLYNNKNGLNGYSIDEVDIVTDTYEIKSIEYRKGIAYYTADTLDNKYTVVIDSTEAPFELKIGDIVETDASCIKGHIRVKILEYSKIGKL